MSSVTFRMNAMALAGCALAVMFSLPAGAGDFAQRKELAERSASEGLGRDQAPLLKRLPGPGKERMLETLKSRFRTPAEGITTAGSAKTERKADRLIVTGTGWQMEVFGDGGKARYRNYGLLEGPKNKPVPVAQRLPQDRLESLGRKFIDEKLKGLVQLGEKEELVPLFTEFQINGGGSTKDSVKPDAESIIASSVVFTRVIDGVHVIGPGSKVAVIFTNDGSAAGFDYDWRAYERTDRLEKVVPIKEVRARAKKLVGLDLDARETTVKRIECGYFDIGSRRADQSVPLQPACAIHSITKRVIDPAAREKDPDAGHVIVAQTDVIPAGENVVRDPKWPTTLKHLGESTRQAGTPKTGPQPKATTGGIRPVAGTVRASGPVAQ